MPNDIITTTAKGWPKLDAANYLRAIPPYTAALAAKLDNADADVAAAINAAARAETAAATAVAAAGRFDCGSEPITVNGAAGATVSITFAAGRFTSPPLVFPVRASSSLAKYIPYVASRSASGAVLGLYSGDGTSGTGTTTLAWFAIQIP